MYFFVDFLNKDYLVLKNMIIIILYLLLTFRHILLYFYLYCKLINSIFKILLFYFIVLEFYKIHIYKFL